MVRESRKQELVKFGDSEIAPATYQRECAKKYKALTEYNFDGICGLQKSVHSLSPTQIMRPKWSLF